MDSNEFSTVGAPIPDPDLLHYACIAQGTTVLAEFNSRHHDDDDDGTLSEIAVKCIQNTPPYHSIFTHTVRSRTYTFLIDKPFVCFAIFDDRMPKSEGLGFLKSVRTALAAIVVAKGKDLESSLGSCHCLQDEFEPVFGQLLGFGIGSLEEESSRFDDDVFEEEVQCGSNTIVGNNNSNDVNGGSSGKMMMKNRLLGEFKLNSGRKKGGSSSDELLRAVRHNSNSKKGELEVVGNHHHHHNHNHQNQKAKKVWKKQVWIILSVDLFICLILFGIWLWICSGFKCMDT